MSNRNLAKWLPLVLVVLFVAGAIAALLYLPEQVQGPAAAKLAPAAPPVATNGVAILPREDDGEDDVAAAPDVSSGPMSADSENPSANPDEDDITAAPRNILKDDDETYPTPFAPQEHSSESHSE